MKVTGLNVFLIDCGNIRPIIVEVETSEGIRGIGEATIAYGAGATAAAGMIKDLGERFILGQDPRRIELLWSAMYDHSFWTKGGGAISFAGISAIEHALWDIKGKMLGVPVYDLLGGRIFDELPVYANGWNFLEIDALSWAKAAERPLKDGFKALKCYPLALPHNRTLTHITRRAADREFLALAYERVKVLRDVVGPDIEIMLDLSGALTTDETIRLCRKYEDLDIAFLEEPGDAFDVGALAQVAKHVSIPIATGERIYTRHGFRKVMEPQNISIVQPDVGNTGGLYETRKIAAMAEAYNMRFAPHNCASTLSTAVSAQVAACSPNFMSLETYPYFSDNQGYIHVLTNPMERDIKDGKLPLNDRPGLGVELDRERVSPFLWAEIR
ncbi:mandelate racemase/muconate lactonizing enzyme family protein [Ottowia thiooxydans]|uniref:Galactonate dehydratase n=1 Tax=Ottowia thiooxydans TaxID=219182 RepID=A0ABV2Q7R7_9BURK